MRQEFRVLRRRVLLILRNRRLKSVAIVALLFLVTSLVWLVGSLPFIQNFFQRESASPGLLSYGATPQGVIGFVVICITAAVLYFYIDYQQHKRPLVMEMPTVIYTPYHHARVVILPKIRYRSRLLSYGLSFGTASFILLAYSLSFFVQSGLAAPPSVTINQKVGTADPNPSYTSVFEVAFSEPIDKATFTTDDITLGGTASGQVVQSITEAGSFDGTTFDVRIQATASGTIEPTIAAGVATSSEGPDTNLASASSDNSVTYSGEWEPGEFIMTVRTSNPGVSSNNQFMITTHSSNTYNYSVDCDNDGNIDFVGRTGDTTCTYPSGGEYDLAITGTFPHLMSYPLDSPSTYTVVDKRKILDVRQWGNNQWKRMSHMFAGASNLQITALDAPDLSDVTDMGNMFMSASAFNSNINHWNTSSVTNMYYLFNSASAFNQPLNAWDVSKVTSMQAIFANASNFNADISDWDTSNLIAMNSMFQGASAFNQPLNAWDVSKVTSMSSMFWNASSFNQPLDSWDTRSVMFMGWMFHSATSFDQSLGAWNVSSVTDMTNMFANGAGLSPGSYDATLTGWASQTLQNNVIFGAGASTYCSGASAKQLIIDTFSWTITDDGEADGCNFESAPDVGTLPATNVIQTESTLNGITSPLGVTERGFQWGKTTSYGQAITDTSDMEYWYKSHFGSAGSGTGQFYSPTDLFKDDNDNIYIYSFAGETPNSLSGGRLTKFDSEGNYLFHWGEAGNGDGQTSHFADPNVTIDSEGNIYISDEPIISGFSRPRIEKYDNNGNFITSWGSTDVGYGTLYAVGAIIADNDDNIYVFDHGSTTGVRPKRMLKFDSSGTLLDEWPLTSGSGNGQFHEDYGIFDLRVDSANNLYATDVGNRRIQKFDSDGNFITAWGSSGSGNGQFQNNIHITIDSEDNIYVYDIGSGANRRIQKFDSDGNFIRSYLIPQGSDVGQINVATGIVIDSNKNIFTVESGSPLSTARVQKFSGSITADLTNLDCGTTYHFRAYATNSTGTSYGDDQTFTTNACDESSSEPFVLKVKTDNDGSSADTEFTVPATTDEHAYNYDVDCDNDGAPEHVAQTGSVTCNYSSAGEYEIAISGVYPHMYHGTPEIQKVVDVLQWGDIEWQSMYRMFDGATNLAMSATDAPDLTQVTDMRLMFAYASQFDSNINHWSVGNVTDMSSMFQGATSFNQPLNNWNVSNVTDMSNMFNAADSFNQDISSWDVSNVEHMYGMFAWTDSFNQPLSAWDVGSVTTMNGMFLGARSFNQDISSWDVSNVIDMSLMFAATSFNQPLNAWDVGSVIIMVQMFGAATSFNQPLNNWNVSNVTDMSLMFAGAESFDQSLAQWNVSNVTDMTYMFGNAGGNLSPLDSGLSTANYDATLIGWDALSLQQNVNFDAGTSTYCNAEIQRQNIITSDSWTIHDNGNNCPPVEVAPPSAPRNLTIISRTSSTINTNWEEPEDDGGSAVTHYHVQYKKSTSSIWISAPTQSAVNTAHNFINLEPETSYDFRVAAINSAGTGPYTSPVTGVTLSLTILEPTPPDPESPTTPTTPESPVGPAQPPAPPTPPVDTNIPTTDVETNQPAPGTPLPDKPPSIPAASEVTKETTTPKFANFAPFAFISLLLLVALAFALRAWNEYRRLQLTTQLAAAYMKTSEDIRAFLDIISHYLNTPIAILKNSLELLTPQNIIPSDALAQLHGEIGGLATLAARLQSEAQAKLQSNDREVDNQTAKVFVSQPTSSVENPVIVVKEKPVWVPLLNVAVLVGVIDAMLIVSNTYTIASLQVWNQVILYILLALMLVLSVYFHKRAKLLHVEQANLLEKQKNFASSKQSLLSGAAVMLGEHHQAISAKSNALQGRAEAKTYFNGLAMLGKLAQSLSFVSRHAVVGGPAGSTNLQLVTQQVTGKYLNTAQQRNIVLQANIPEKLYVQAHGDEISYIIEQLLDNAMKFSPENSLVSITAAQVGKKVKVTISDQGSGIPQAKRDNLFKPFDRGAGTETYNVEGIGMGLHNAKYLIDRLGGSIVMKDNQPQGLITEVELPYVKPMVDNNKSVPVLGSQSGSLVTPE